MRADQPVLSVVVPMYDEEEVLPLFFERMHPLLDGLGIDRRRRSLQDIVFRTRVIYSRPPG